MIKLLPFILIPVIIIAALGYWRFIAIKGSITPANTQTASVDIQPVEVPKTLPNATIDERVKSLEDLTSKVVISVNGLKTGVSPTASSLDSRLKDAEGAITDLKARVSALEKATPAPVVSSSQSVAYIPLGSGGGPWANQDWYTTPEYQISLDPASYPGYTGMYLEVTFKLSEQAGTGSVRLYNKTDSATTSSQVDTTSSTFTLFTTSSFKLASGSKTYALSVKSSQGKDLFIQNARIRVSF